VTGHLLHGPLSAASLDAALDVVWDRRRQDPDGSLATAERLRDDALDAGDLVAFGRAQTVVAACHLIRNDYAAGLRAGLEALTHLEGGPIAHRARALAEVGTLEIQCGEHASGIERLLEAVALHGELDATDDLAADLNRIGIAFYSCGDLDDAAHAYRRALALVDSDGQPLVAAGTRNNLAKVLTAKGEHEAALDHLRAARAAFADAGELRGLGMTFHNAAVVAEELGEPARAEEHLHTSIGHYDEAGHVHGACEARTRLARLRARAGATEEALTLLVHAHDAAEGMGASDECLHAASALADVHEQRGEHAAALRWLRHARQVELARHDEDADHRLRALQVRFQLDRLERDSITDPLTGLVNRRGLEARLTQLDAPGQDRELAVLLFDLDDFKQVNDRFTHSVGDEVLRAVGDLLLDGTRPSDLCVRFGGEEFVVVLPGCDLDQATGIAEELREAIRSHPWAAIADGLAVTSSVGVAVRSQVRDTSALLLAADRAMYVAKHEGKDQVRT
jgi:diguanylate cyclase (GGDEF)-like protein